MEAFELTVLWACAGMLTLALILGITRLLIGPTSLDRVVSLDTIVAVAQCAIAVFIGFSLDPTTAPTIVALALIAFLGSVSIARFRVPDSGFVPAVWTVSAPRTRASGADTPRKPGESCRAEDTTNSREAADGGRTP